MKISIFLFSVLVLSQIFFIVSASDVRADEVKFGQKILPVELVYMTKKGEISKVWSNVSQKDDAYVLKFIASDGKTEIIPRGDIMKNFVKIKEGKREISQKSEKDIRIFLKNDKIEQIETVS